VTKASRQSGAFAPAEKLFDICLDSKKHFRGFRRSRPHDPKSQRDVHGGRAGSSAAGAKPGVRPA